MKTIADVLEKLDINKVNLDDETHFPLDEGLQKAIEYLKQNKFGEIDTTVYQIDNAPTTIEAFNKEKDRSFYVFSNRRGGILRFADTTSKIVSQSNPCLELLFIGDDADMFIYNCGPNDCNRTCTKEDFIKLANKYFNL